MRLKDKKILSQFQDHHDNIEFHAWSGETASPGTGPNDDLTGSGGYIYMEGLIIYFQNINNNPRTVMR